MNKRIIISLLAILLAQISFAQLRDFSQNYSMGLLLSPSFAGIHEKSRVAVNYRNHYPAVKNFYESYSIQADTYFDRFNSGLGAIVIQDKYCNGTLSYTEAIVQYSFNIQLFDKLWARPGLQVGYFDQKLNMQKLTFGDMIVDEYGSFTIVNPSTEIPIVEKVRFFDIASSLLIYTNKAWIGVTFGNLNKQNTSFYVSEAIKPMLFSVNSGISFFSRKDTAQYKLNRVVASVIYKKYGTFRKYMVGTNIHLSPFELGLAYKGTSFTEIKRNINSLSLLIGYKIRDFKVGYSFDFALFHPFNAHEITLLYSFG